MEAQRALREETAILPAAGRCGAGLIFGKAQVSHRCITVALSRVFEAKNAGPPYEPARITPLFACRSFVDNRDRVEDTPLMTDLADFRCMVVRMGLSTAFCRSR